MELFDVLADPPMPRLATLLVFFKHVSEITE